MVGDIFGKNWSSSSASGSGSSIGIGIVEKNPNLFGDLVSSALGGQGKSNSNVPLKNSAPSSNKSSFSMGNVADSLPKTGNSVKTGGNWGSSESFGSFTTGFNASYSNSNSNSNRNNDNSVNGNKGLNLGGPSMRSGVGMSSNKDPFGSLLNFNSKQSGTSVNSTTKSSSGSAKVNAGVDAFGDFQNASKLNSSTETFPSSGDDFIGVNFGSDSKTSDFGIPGMDFGSKSQTPVQNSGSDPLDMLFSSSSASAGGAVGGQQKSDVDDWDTEFGGGLGEHDGGGSTTELDGLPPPPAGVSASMAKNKGMDNYKQGQYADAIKWLSWAVILIEKAGDDAATVEVLSSRASCYKEVGEYKKAVADCTKILAQDEANVSVLVQRALLYESMEKYKLGAEDLRTVLKIDPVNRIARSTVHRLTKMAE